MSPTPAPLLLSPADAARLLAISRAKLYELLEDGSVPSVHIGRSRRIAYDELVAYVESLKGLRARRGGGT
jgi:excisionase family DNA binding protein